MRAQDLLESMPAIFPADFFFHSVEIQKKETDLPDLSDLLGEEAYAKVSLYWSLEGIGGSIVGEYLLEESYFPQYEKGDAWEFFIDTRDNKESGIPSRFCHHFIFYGTKEQVQAMEITKCRADDAHTLCDPRDIQVQILDKKKGYEIRFFFPKEILHGYDPLQCPKIGFAYRIHRYKAPPKHFSMSGKYTDIWQHCSNWASLLLV